MLKSKEALRYVKRLWRYWTRPGARRAGLVSPGPISSARLRRGGDIEHWDPEREHEVRFLTPHSEMTLLVTADAREGHDPYEGQDWDDGPHEGLLLRAGEPVQD